MHKLSRAEHIDVRTAASKADGPQACSYPPSTEQVQKYPGHVPHHMMPNALLPWTRTP